MHKTRVAAFVLNSFKNDSRVLKENISLQKAGYDVTVVALHESPLAERETLAGISVHRIKLKSRAWPKQRLVQLLKYVEFIFRAVGAYRQSDILHCNDLNTLPIGVIIKRVFNRDAKIVYDAHEYETEQNGLGGWRKRIVKWLERGLIGYADAVITVSGGIADEYVRLYGIPRPALVLNTPLRRPVVRKNLFRDTFGIGEEQAISLYQGSLSRGRGIENIIETFKGMEASGQVLVLMGYGPLAKIVKEAAAAHRNIYYHEAVPPEVVLDYTASADVGLSLIENSCLSYYYCLPNKVFEYAMAGLPVIVSGLYEMRRIVEAYGIGAVIASDDEAGFRAAVEEIDAIGAETLQYNLERFAETFNWEAQEQVLLGIYKALA